MLFLILLFTMVIWVVVHWHKNKDSYKQVGDYIFSGILLTILVSIITVIATLIYSNGGVDDNSFAVTEAKTTKIAVDADARNVEFRTEIDSDELSLVFKDSDGNKFTVPYNKPLIQKKRVRIIRDNDEAPRVEYTYKYIPSSLWIFPIPMDLREKERWDVYIPEGAAFELK